jgi:hypothetical protein
MPRQIGSARSSTNTMCRSFSNIKGRHERHRQYYHVLADGSVNQCDHMRGSRSTLTGLRLPAPKRSFQLHSGILLGERTAFRQPLSQGPRPSLR